VSTAAGTSPDSDFVFYQFTGTGGGPTVTGVSPNSGPTGGGTPVTITGSGFTGTTAVRFGGVPATSVVVVNSATITAVSPAHVAGTVFVQVTAPGGTSPGTLASQFTYVGNVPVVTGVTPNSGPLAGGTPVTITGANFLGATAVSFGGTPALAFTVHNDATITATSPGHAAGTVNVIVTNAIGSSTGTTASQFTYTSGGPIITGLSPTGGPTAGGTTVTITGSGFLTTTAVSFGGVPATGFTVLGPNTISAIAPPHASGTVFVRVTTTGGITPDTASAQYTYSGALPIVSSVSPNNGPTSGGTIVTITGVGFLGATAVTFGGTPSTFTVNSDTQITAVAPAHAAGTFFVQVTAPAGTSGQVTSAQFSYTTTGPVITGLTPPSGSTAGGNTVIITGTGFTGTTQVTFDGTPAAFVLQSSTSISATAPAHAAGTVFVRVVTPAGTSSGTVASQYTYTGGPVVSGVSPASGPTAGGTIVTITGTGFAGATSVRFGGTAAAFTVVSSTQITATAPAHSAGTFFVTVTTAAGTSGEVTAARFTFVAPSGETHTYTLVFRWTLISWMGRDGIPVREALMGMESPDNPATNNILLEVTVIWRFQSLAQEWEANFPNAGNIPGINDFEFFQEGVAYFIAIRGPGNVVWVILEGD
jgi:hypothetical protein